MEIDLSKLEPRHAHDLLTGSIIPRPIAWVSTINNDGKSNFAPFSFFTGVQWHPPALAFSVVNRADGSKKNTVINIEQTGEFVINLVSTDLLKAMETSAKPHPPGEKDDLPSNLHLISSTVIKPCRIQESPISFECALDRIVRIDEGADAGNLIIGRIRLMHINDKLLLDRDIDWKGLNILGRLSKNRYCAVNEVIESQTN